jgi:transcriptional regulator with XRE-family HTH domain
MHIGYAIRSTRERLGLTLEAVAMEAGFDAGNLSRMERGQQAVTVDRLAQVARALQVRVSDLFLLIESPSTEAENQLRDSEINRYDEEMQSVRRIYSALDSQHRQIALQMLRGLTKAQKAAADQAAASRAAKKTARRS